MPAVLEIDLSPMDGSQPQGLRRLGELHRARQRVVVGQRECFVAALHRRGNQLLGL
jgi:hypothetical protein